MDARDKALNEFLDKRKERIDYENSQYDKHRKKDDYSGLTAIFDDPKKPTMTNEELEDMARDFVAFMEQKIGQERADGQVRTVKAKPWTAPATAEVQLWMKVTSAAHHDGRNEKEKAISTCFLKLVCPNCANFAP